MDRSGPLCCPCFYFEKKSIPVVDAYASRKNLNCIWYDVIAVVNVSVIKMAESGLIGLPVITVYLI